jgi:hypothetical protein
VRDPADEQPPQTFTQSNFANRVYTVTQRWVVLAQPPFAPVYRWVSRLNPGPGAPLPGGGGAMFLLMDAVVYARPKQGLAVQPDGGLVAIAPANPWQPGGDGLVCAPIAFGAPVIDAAMHPDQIGAIIIAGEAVSVAGAPDPHTPRDIQVIDPTTRETTTIAQVDGATKLLLGRDRAVYVLAGTSLHRIELPDASEELLPEPVAGRASSPRGPRPEEGVRGRRSLPRRIWCRDGAGCAAGRPARRARDSSHTSPTPAKPLP